jgi:hypothetical protein
MIGVMTIGGTTNNWCDDHWSEYQCRDDKAMICSRRCDASTIEREKMTI